MAQVNMKGIVDHLSDQMKQALAEALSQMPGGSQVDSLTLYRQFKQAVDHKCKAWEQVPDHCVNIDV